MTTAEIEREALKIVVISLACVWREHRDGPVGWVIADELAYRVEQYERALAKVNAEQIAAKALQVRT